MWFVRREDDRRPANNWGRKERHYSCRKAWQGVRKPGCGRACAADPLEGAIWDRVIAWLSDPDKLLEQVEARRDLAKLEEELRLINEELQRAERGRAAVLEALTRGLVPSDQGLDALNGAKRRIEELVARKGDVEAALARSRLSGLDRARLREQAAGWLQRLDEMDFIEKQKLVRALVTRVVVHENRLVVHARVPSSVLEQQSLARNMVATIDIQDDAIAAVIIGGTSFVRGNGGVIGSLVGVALIAVLRNGMNLRGWTRCCSCRRSARPSSWRWWRLPFLVSGGG